MRSVGGNKPAAATAYFHQGNCFMLAKYLCTLNITLRRPIPMSHKTLEGTRSKVMEDAYVWRTRISNEKKTQFNIAQATHCHHQSCHNPMKRNINQILINLSAPKWGICLQILVHNTQMRARDWARECVREWERERGCVCVLCGEVSMCCSYGCRQE